MKGLFFPSSRRLVVAALAALALGGPAHRLGAAIQVADAPPHPSDPISLVAARVQNWREGRTEVLLCDGPLYIAQGLHRIWAQRTVIWMTSEPAVAATGPAAAAGGTHLVVYTEGKVLASLAQSTVE